MASGMKKSDEAVLPVKAANKGAQAPAEPPEGRASTKGNLRDQSTPRTQGRDGVSQAVERIRQAATRKPQEKLTALLHHITTDALRCAFYDLQKTASAGVDGLVWREYEDRLEERLLDLHERVHSGAYRALPSRRVAIPKPDGGTRPLGIIAGAGAGEADSGEGPQAALVEVGELVEGVVAATMGAAHYTRQLNAQMELHHRTHVTKKRKLFLRRPLRVTVAHYPPATSKWNPIEHRLFCEVTTPSTRICQRSIPGRPTVRSASGRMCSSSSTNSRARNASSHQMC